MAIYKNLRVKTTTTYNGTTDSSGSYGFKSITLEEAFSTAAYAATRITNLKSDPRMALGYLSTNAQSAGNESYFDNAEDDDALPKLKLESWSLTEKSYLDANKVSQTRYIVKYTIKIQDFWVSQ